MSCAYYYSDDDDCFYIASGGFLLKSSCVSYSQGCLPHVESMGATGDSMSGFALRQPLVDWWLKIGYLIYLW